MHQKKEQEKKKICTKYFERSVDGYFAVTALIIISCTGGLIALLSFSVSVNAKSVFSCFMILFVWHQKENHVMRKGKLEEEEITTHLPLQCKEQKLSVYCLPDIEYMPPPSPPRGEEGIGVPGFF